MIKNWPGSWRSRTWPKPWWSESGPNLIGNLTESLDKNKATHDLHRFLSTFAKHAVIYDVTMRSDIAIEETTQTAVSTPGRAKSGMWEIGQIRNVCREMSVGRTANSIVIFKACLLKISGGVSSGGSNAIKAGLCLICLGWYVWNSCREVCGTCLGGCVESLGRFMEETDCHRPIKACKHSRRTPVEIQVF